MGPRPQLSTSGDEGRCLGIFRWQPLDLVPPPDYYQPRNPKWETQPLFVIECLAHCICWVSLGASPSIRTPYQVLLRCLGVLLTNSPVFSQFRRSTSNICCQLTPGQIQGIWRNAVELRVQPFHCRGINHYAFLNLLVLGIQVSDPFESLEGVQYAHPWLC